jgi:CDP-glycerol glycerophosphotransferase
MYWAALFANAVDPGTGKSIYLHNDMYREKDRIRSLESMFRLYESYDLLVSLTKSAHEENVRQLSQAFNLSPDRFDYCDDVANAQGARELAARDR